MKVTKDLIAYLEEIDKLAKPLDKERKQELETILTVILKLLICMKKQSGMGRFKFSWE